MENMSAAMNNGGSISPIPDKAAMLSALSAMFEPADVVELRAFHKGKKRTDAGYFDGEHRQVLADEAERLNSEEAAVYVTLNKIDPQLLGRYCNRVEKFAAATATDANVDRRRWLLLDFDPVRPKDTSATDVQLAAAHQKVRECAKALKEAGWPDPMAGQSGNGWHLLYPLDLPNDAGSRDLVKGALAGLAERFDDAVVTVDRAVFNAARITKLFGTVANKGDHTPLTPWRLSRLVSTPTRDAVVTEDQLRALHPNPAKAQPAVNSGSSGGSRSDFDLSDFLARLTIPYEQDQHESRDRYKLAHCPFNSDHGRGESAIFRSAAGVLGFKCQHNSCADKHWQDVRALLDGTRDAREQRRTVASRPATAEHQPGAKTAQQASLNRPEPLPSLPDVLPFDYSYMPDALRGYVKDISERMQCPPDFAAVGVLVMMATIIGRKVGIRPMRHNDWVVIVNLWVAVVGNSGVMKSPTLAAALTPIKKLQAAAYEIFNTAKAEHDAKAELAKLQKSLNKTKARASLKKNQSADAKELLQSGEIDDAPILKRYITNNASYEALGELMMENPNGLMVESDELIGLLKQLDASGQEVARSFYLTAADGNSPYTFDRIMRGKGLHIEALCLSIVGGVQPGVLAEYVRQATAGGAGADGLLQRFGLMVYPDVSPDWKEVDRYPDSTARDAVNRLAERLDNLKPADIGADADMYGGVPFLHFDDAAQALFSEWRTTLEHRLRSGEEHPAIVSHLSKYRKLIPSLALINHLCDATQGRVSESALLRAIAFSEYLESHARRIYSYATRPDIDAAKTLLKRLASGKLPDVFKARELSQKGWAGLENPSKAQSAIDLLLEYHHLIAEEITTGGRPTTYYHWVKSGAA
jgi:hypothetical protein